MITEDSIVHKSKEQLMSLIDNEAVILGFEVGKYIGLNEIGTEIWNRLDQPTKVSSLIKDFTDLYDEKESTIRDHILEFLNALYHKSLINIVDES